MLTAYELQQVDQATEDYCVAQHINGQGERRAVHHQMLLAFTARKQLNLHDGQVVHVVDLHSETLIEIIQHFPRME